MEKIHLDSRVVFEGRYEAVGLCILVECLLNTKCTAEDTAYELPKRFHIHLSRTR